MWRIAEHRRVDKQLDAMPQEILKRYEKWKDIATISGPAGLRLIKGLHDESLPGSGKDIVLRDLDCNTESFTERYRRINYLRWFQLRRTIIGGDKR
jgi:hypothetical protein